MAALRKVKLSRTHHEGTRQVERSIPLFFDDFDVRGVVSVTLSLFYSLDRNPTEAGFDLYGDQKNSGCYQPVA